MKKYLKLSFILLAVASLVGFKTLNNKDAQVPSAQAAAVDYFLKIDGIDGESKDERHKNEIEILSWSWGETSSETGLLLPAIQAARLGTGGGAGKVSFSDFSFQKHMSKASPKLAEYVASGKVIPEVTFTGYRAGGEGRQNEFMIVKFREVYITSYQTGGSSTDVLPMDSFSLNFTKIEFEYKTQKEDGTQGESVKFGWDLKENKAI